MSEITLMYLVRKVSLDLLVSVVHKAPQSIVGLYEV